MSQWADRKIASAIAGRLRRASETFVVLMRSSISHRLLVVPVVVAMIGIFSARGTRCEEINKSRVFIGLSKGDLKRENDADLQSFLVLQNIVRAVQKQLSAMAERIVISDLSSDWSTDEDWRNLADRGYTHYLIAGPKRSGVGNLVDVSWTVGKLTRKGQSFFAYLKEHTYILIPQGDEVARVKNPKDANREYNEIEAATDLANSLRLLFPELSKVHKYFVECFDSTSADTWRDWRSVIMVHLSYNLQNGSWHPAWLLPSADLARKLCSDSGYRTDPQYDYSHADVLIHGTMLNASRSGIPVGQRVFSTWVEIEDRVGERRHDLTVGGSEDESTAHTPLTDFCVPEATTLPVILRDLTQYIQAQGLQHAQYVPKWRCDRQ